MKISLSHFQTHDAECRVICMELQYPMSVHDYFVWHFSWFCGKIKQERQVDNSRLLLGEHTRFISHAYGGCAPLENHSTT